MAYKLIHRAMAQELRFPNQRAAEHYADRFGGGLDKWNITVAAHVTATALVVASPRVVSACVRERRAR